MFRLAMRILGPSLLLAIVLGANGLMTILPRIVHPH